MYRAIKMINGGEQVEYKHFNTINAAYDWLIPTNTQQEEERWHLKLLPAVCREFVDWNATVVTMGWNEQENNEQTRYIQRVDMWNDYLPRF
jgi:hypothetical protein